MESIQIKILSKIGDNSFLFNYIDNNHYNKNDIFLCKLAYSSQKGICKIDDNKIFFFGFNNVTLKENEIHNLLKYKLEMRTFNNLEVLKKFIPFVTRKNIDKFSSEEINHMIYCLLESKTDSIYKSRLNHIKEVFLNESM